MRMGGHSTCSSFSRERFEEEFCFGGTLGDGKRIKVAMMFLTLDIDKKDGEVACIRLGGVSNSALLS